MRATYPEDHPIFDLDFALFDRLEQPVSPYIIGADLDEYFQDHGIVNFTFRETLRLRRLGVVAPKPPDAWMPRIVRTLQVAQILRAWEGGPLLVGNGYRPKDLNRRAGGSRRSKHIVYRALDLDRMRNPHDHAANRRFCQGAVALFYHYRSTDDLWLRLGIYRRGGGSRVHIDTGSRRWPWQFGGWKRSYIKELAALAA